MSPSRLPFVPLAGPVVYFALRFSALLFNCCSYPPRLAPRAQACFPSNSSSSCIAPRLCLPVVPFAILLPVLLATSYPVSPSISPTSGNTTNFAPAALIFSGFPQPLFFSCHLSYALSAPSMRIASIASSPRQLFRPSSRKLARPREIHDELLPSDRSISAATVALITATADRALINASLALIRGNNGERKRGRCSPRPRCCCRCSMVACDGAEIHRDCKDRPRITRLGLMDRGFDSPGQASGNHRFVSGVATTSH